MKVYKEYRKLENMEEINIHNILEKEFYKPAEKKFDLENVPFQKVMSNIATDIDIFLPYPEGNDFIIQGLGSNTLERGHITPEDVIGRLLSECSPMYYKLLYESLLEVHETHKEKKLRFLYYNQGKLARFSNVKILEESGRIFLLSNHMDITENTLYIPDDNKHEEDKANLIEYFSQTGSYYKIDGKYSWTQGIYNIINRKREESDEHYNIIFDLVVPEDKPIVEELLKIMDSGKQTFNTELRIKTYDGQIKYLELSLYSKFDENNNLISRYGVVKDITSDSGNQMTRPIDFILNGFKNKAKIALLIDPLNEKQYEFSESFYNIIEENKENYSHKKVILENIVEQETIENFRRLFRGEIKELDETFTYNVHGDPDNQKICDIYIEIFEFGENEHSIGFLTDITEERIKQKELEAANEHQKVLIKEVHHRVKNNLQILNSFLNLEKRAYKNKPNIIIDHMQSRLSSLAILHEKTYNTTDFQNINLKSYIKDQDAQLRTLIGIRDGIKFESEVDETLNLSIEIITPLLLVIDELTMNAIKHAFPDKSMKNKKITKEITVIDENTAQLILKDNGVGIGDNKDIKSNLGCEIIKNLTKQLDGKIELMQPEVGTAYKLTFPTNMEHTISK